MIRVLLTGGSGFLGSRIQAYYRQKRERNWQIIAPTHTQVNFAEAKQIVDCMHRIEPKLIIHCAAAADTTWVMEHPEESYRLTVDGSCYLAQEAEKRKIPLILMSSDYVYQGRTIQGEQYHTEKDENKEEEAGTENVYGSQKLEAEQKCFAIHQETIALRLSWMYDLPREGMKTKVNLLTGLWKAMEKGTAVSYPCHEYRGITDVWQVVKKLEQASKLPGGSYNFGSPNHLSTAETVRRAGEVLGISKEQILADEKRYSERPRNLTMDMDKLYRQGIEFPHTEEQLRLVTERYFNEKKIGYTF